MKVFICLVAFLAVAQALPRTHVDGPETRISGGKPASKSQFPYACGLFQGRYFLCGCSLISSKFVLTSARCVNRPQSNENLTVVLGAYEINNPEETTQLRVNVPLSYVKKHKNYDEGKRINDIATIRLPNKVQFTEYIKPVALPARSDEPAMFDGVSATIYGWGKVSEGTSYSPVLRFVKINILKNTGCARLIGEKPADTQLCASGSSFKSACNGDEGGALTVVRKGETIQVGVMSVVSKQGCEHGIPHVYTRVTKYLTWIQENSDVVIQQQ